jgi:hypothetical protein
MLIQDLFSRYIDWRTLEALLEKDYFNENSQESRQTLRIMESCAILKRIMEGTDKN